jgi:phosphoenolpyruvate synthase/pyruvate phosphate dikinase
MHSSAVGEDTKASFAGQYISELNVTRENILHAYKSVVASKYSPRAILYRLRYGLDDRETPMCVAGIVMIDSKSSGVLYTVDPSRPESSVLKISALWGLGEHLVSGEASPDVFLWTGPPTAYSNGISAEKRCNLSIWIPKVYSLKKYRKKISRCHPLMTAPLIPWFAAD